MSLTSTVQRRFVGSALRHYREQLGLTAEEAAGVLDCDLSKISRVETGLRPIRSAELETLLDVYGVFGDEQRSLLALASPPRGRAATWWHPYANALPSTSCEYVGLEGQAERILLYGGDIVPELLQTRAYASAGCSADLSVYVGSEDTRVEATCARQQAILEDRSASIEVVLTEAALRQQVGAAKAMHEQLGRLAELATGSRYPWISLRVVPCSAGATAAAGFGSFSVLRFEALPAFGIVHLAGPGGGICLEQPEDAYRYSAVFAQTQVGALSHSDSLAMLRRMAEE